MHSPLLPEQTRSTTYFKRFRMEIELESAPPPQLEPGCHWVPWHPSLLDAHADVLCQSFHDEIDAFVFASLSDRTGCYCLMSDICRKPGFLPEATWLLAYGGDYCGTVQGVRERNGMGSIQNLGIVPRHRGRGLGTALLLQALQGFRRAGLGRVLLEVTARNESAVRLYQRLGFRRRKTLYKAATAGVC